MQAAVRQVDLVDRHVDAAQRTFDGVDVIHFQLGVLLRNADNSNAFDVFPCTSEQGIFGEGTG